MKAQFVEVDGLSTRYLSAGEGRSVLMLHGIGMSGDCFHRNFATLAKRFRVIAPDMLGHGFTGYRGFQGLPPPLAMARHMASFLDCLGVDECTVVGSSLGGLVSALLYLERPRIVAKLVLAASSSCFNSPERQAATLRASAANAFEAMKEPSLAGLRNRLRNIVYSDAGVSEELLMVQLAAYAYPDRAIAYVETISQIIETATRPEGQVAHRLGAIACPILMVAGSNDIRTPVETQLSGVGRFQHAALKVYDECGHFPFLEHPARFNADLTAFVEAASPINQAGEGK